MTHFETYCFVEEVTLKQPLKELVRGSIFNKVAGFFYLTSFIKELHIFRTPIFPNIFYQVLLKIGKIVCSYCCQPDALSKMDSFMVFIQGFWQPYNATPFLPLKFRNCYQWLYLSVATSAFTLLSLFHIIGTLYHD